MKREKGPCLLNPINDNQIFKPEGDANTKTILERVLLKVEYCCICFKTGSLNHLSSSTAGNTSMDQLIRVFGEKIRAKLTNDLICNECNDELDSVNKFFDKVEYSTKTMHYLIHQLTTKVDSLISNIQESSSNEIENTVIFIKYPSKSIETSQETEENGDFCTDSEQSFSQNCPLPKYLKGLQTNKTEHKYSCNICGLSLKTSNNLEVHKEKCSKIVTKTTYKCTDCNKSFNTRKRFNTHFHNTHLKNEDTEKNKDIRERYTQSSVTKAGFKAGKRNRRCYLCPAVFTKNKELQEHLATNHSPDEKYYCDKCNGIYKNRLAFMRHIYSYGHLRRVDPNLELPFKCAECVMSFGSIAELESHANSTHLNQRPYKCDKCGKDFAAKIHLQRHVVRHEQQRRYECNKCKQRFTEMTGLKAHTMRFHKTQCMPAACEKCGKTFVSMYQCKLHQQRAHSTRSVVCPICNSMYHTLINVRTHVRKVHLKKLSLSEYMDKKGYNKELEDMFMDRRMLSKEQRLLAGSLSSVDNVLDKDNVTMEVEIAAF